MSKRYVRAIILCEDRRQGNLVRGYLVRTELAKNGQVRVRLPTGGSGEQWVRKRYPDEVREIRRRAYQRQLILVTVMDADMHSVDQRYTQLDTQLVNQNLEPRSSSEPLFVLVPKRNVETWIWFLNANPVNQEDDYKDRVENQHCSGAVTELCRIRASEWSLPREHPPSLARGCDELRRIEEGRQR